ncbi:hypothetical protein FQA39_LY03696 [Lamprigera yunnana]|nr:hypothetical protein FQA39_LY03696 [Lamprigera yunnana]
MTNDSEHIQEQLDFNCCSTPRGTLYYDLDCLTSDQQQNLNEYKISEARENEIYLSKHPEIGGLIVLALQNVLQLRPRTNVEECVGRFFMQSRTELENALQEYFESREPRVYEGNSAVCLREESINSLLEEGEEEESEERQQDENKKDVSIRMLDIVLQETFERLGLTDNDRILQKPLIETAPECMSVKETMHDVNMNPDKEPVLKYLLNTQDEDDQVEHDENSSADKAENSQ